MASNETADPLLLTRTEEDDLDFRCGVPRDSHKNAAFSAIGRDALPEGRRFAGSGLESVHRTSLVLAENAAVFFAGGHDGYKPDAQARNTSDSLACASGFDKIGRSHPQAVFPRRNAR